MALCVCLWIVARTQFMLCAVKISWIVLDVYFSIASGSKPNAPEVREWMRELNDWFTVGEKVCAI